MWPNPASQTDYLLFDQHSICTKSTFPILDTHSASKTNICAVLRIKRKKIPNYHDLAKNGWIEGWCKKIYFLKTSEKMFFNNSECTQGTSY